MKVTKSNLGLDGSIVAYLPVSAMVMSSWDFIREFAFYTGFCECMSR